MDTQQNNVIVTGGAGYIGSHACKALHDKGYLPIVIDSLELGHEWAVQWGPLFSYHFPKNENEIRQVFQTYKPIGVMHFAAYSAVGESVANPLKYYENNIQSSLCLLKLMQEFDCKNFIFSSTCSIYGEAQYVPLDEMHPIQPVNPYGKSKRMVETILQDFSKTKKINYASLRYFNAAGANENQLIGEQHTPETHLIPLILMAAAGKKDCIKVFGTNYDTPDGTCIRDYIHVTDLAEAHVKALEYIIEKQENLELNLGIGKGYSVKEVIEIAKQVTQKNIPTLYSEKREGDPPVLVANPSLAKKILNWNPRYQDLETIILHAWQWMQKDISTFSKKEF